MTADPVPTSAHPLRRQRARTQEWRWWAAAMLVAVLVFGLWPRVDLVFSGLFYAPATRSMTGEGFPLGTWPVVRTLYEAVPWMGRLALVGSALAVVAVRLKPRWQNRRWRRRTAAAMLVMVLGGWLLINVGLKEHWGRPRPAATVAFGGELPFMPALQPSNLCRTNCSFVSGHAATGFCLLALGLFGAPATRRRWLLAGWLTGCGFGLGRVVQGAHFASDVLFGGLLIWAVALVVREVWLRTRAMRRRRKTRRAVVFPVEGRSLTTP